MKKDDRPTIGASEFLRQIREHGAPHFTATLSGRHVHLYDMRGRAPNKVRTFNLRDGAAMYDATRDVKRWIRNDPDAPAPGDVSRKLYEGRRSGGGER